MHNENIKYTLLWNFMNTKINFFFFKIYLFSMTNGDLWPLSLPPFIVVLLMICINIDTKLMYMFVFIWIKYFLTNNYGRSLFNNFMQKKKKIHFLKKIHNSVLTWIAVINYPFFFFVSCYTFYKNYLLLALFILIWIQ